jgi:putative hydrolase of HD superfamily
MMALLMSEYAEEPVDVLRVMAMVLVHDIVELDAGDTYAYDDEGNRTKRQREVAAANRIFHILPEDQAAYLHSLWEEFEAAQTAEARFAHTLDNFQPMMLNDATGGKAWKEHEVRLSQVMKRQETTGDGSQELWEYARRHFLEKNVKAGVIIDDSEETI